MLGAAHPCTFHTAGPPAMRRIVHRRRAAARPRASLREARPVGGASSQLRNRCRLPNRRRPSGIAASLSSGMADELSGSYRCKGLGSTASHVETRRRATRFRSGWSLTSAVCAESCPPGRARARWTATRFGSPVAITATAGSIRTRLSRTIRWCASSLLRLQVGASYMGLTSPPRRPSRWTRL